MSGSSTYTIDVVDTLAAGGTRLTAAVAPCRPSAATVTWADGVTANSVQRMYMKSASLAATAIDINLETVATSDGTTGFIAWRELVIFNDSTTDDLTFGLGTTPITASFMGGTNPTVIIPPGGVFRHVKPLGSTGYDCTTNNGLRLDSGASTIAYRIIILGN